MGGPGSGRSRKLKRIDLDLTPFDGTVATAKKRLSEIEQGLLDGKLDPRLADTLIAAERATITAATDDAKERRLDEYRELVKRAEELNKQAARREVADRQHSGE